MESKKNEIIRKDWYGFISWCQKMGRKPNFFKALDDYIKAKEQK